MKLKSLIKTMRTISWHKQGALCIQCKKNKVPLGKSLRPCEECRKSKSRTSSPGDVAVSQGEPAAIVETDEGQKIFVDKFGKEVPNPGYDLKNDPRGWRHTGKLKDKPTII